MGFKKCSKFADKQYRFSRHGGVKKSENSADVIYGSSPIALVTFHLSPLINFKMCLMEHTNGEVLLVISIVNLSKKMTQLKGGAR